MGNVVSQRFLNKQEIELVVFGPGVGESVLLHLGDNQWVIVDSCVDSGTREAAPLRYLRDHNVDPVEAVKLVIISHWHDDHIKGISSIVEQCRKAKIVLPTAFCERSFRTFIEIYNDRPLTKYRSVSEISSVMRHILDAKRVAKLTLENHTVWRSPENSSLQCTITSLSPSSQSVIDFLGYAASEVDKATIQGSSKRHPIADGPNDLAIVLWVEFENLSILLGSDLEESGDRRKGWSTILSSDERPRGKANIFKIPHHGSINGHHSDVWGELLNPKPLCVVTPFRSSGLPRDRDISRICSHAGEAFLTAPSKADKLPKRAKIVEEMTRGAVRSHTSLRSKYSYLSMRGEPSDPIVNWLVVTFGQCGKVCSSSV